MQSFNSANAPFAMRRNTERRPLPRMEFSKKKKWQVVCVGLFVTWNSTLGSTLPSGAVNEIAAQFSIDDHSLLVLLNSLFLVGYTVGPLIFGPLSERIGRRPVIIGTYTSYILFSMASALSPRYWILLLFRVLCGTVSAAPNAVVAGMYADIYDDPAQRGRAMAYFLASGTIGPPIGPVISGLTSSISWRLSFWIGMALAGSGLPLVLLMPETYRPVLEGRPKPREIDQQEALSASNLPVPLGITSSTFARPFKMMVQEPIVLLTSLYIALVYSILYLFFQSYPIIFTGVYGMSSAVAGLAFLPMSVGSLIGLLLVLLYDLLHTRAKVKGAAWAYNPVYDRLPLACMGGPTVVIALFWLGWTASSSIHPVIPMMSGLCFGAGYLLIFIAMLNYLSDAYKQFSASAQAAASATRSIAAICLPFAATPMYTNLGVQWACSLLAFIFLAMTAIPFIFMKYDKLIRQRSSFCQQIDSVR